jgi:WD40 repeat protein
MRLEIRFDNNIPFSGSICIWNQNKTLKKSLKFHEEAVHVLAFSSDSNIFLTACTMGNIRLFLINDFEGT